MRKRITSLTLLAGMALFPLAANAGSGVKVGFLKCYTERGVGWVIGSSRDVDCEFRPTHRGKKEYYTGSIGKLGLDLGLTNETVLGWVVFAPGKLNDGALKGSYTGASAEATLGLGLGANVLVGGFRKGINLQPVSLQAQTGLNVAAGVTSLNLRPVKKKYYKP